MEAVEKWFAGKGTAKHTNTSKMLQKRNEGGASTCVENVEKGLVEGGGGAHKWARTKKRAITHDRRDPQRLLNPWWCRQTPSGKREAGSNWGEKGFFRHLKKGRKGPENPRKGDIP